jgi:alkanesulfonate monooxygenase SsuD/methylene tetrahydromethanopterin reductase-like flavin-dependent oxidoreductase (luciferase family)
MIERETTMRLGLFMMPLHPPRKDYHQMLEEDLEAVIHADQLGFDDVWIGEHFSSMTEPITSPLTFLAKAIPLTKQIRLCTGVLNLPQQHPAVVAGFAAMFDHLADGRFLMGIGPGGLPSDFELFHLEDHMARGRMTLESIDIILKIWGGQPPYDIQGEFWQIRQKEWHWPELGLGDMPKPYQQPHPPIAVAGMSPYPFFVKEAARRGWQAISANFIPAASVATHWQRFSEGCAEAGTAPDGERWHVGRTVLVTETDAEAEAYLAKPDCAVRYYFYYLSKLMKKAGFSQIMKGLEQFDDEQLTVDWAIDNIVIAGSPATVADKLLAVREQVGPFGTLVLTGLDWDDPALWKRSMALTAEEVMPRLREATTPAIAAK